MDSEVKKSLATIQVAGDLWLISIKKVGGLGGTIGETGITCLWTLPC